MHVLLATTGYPPDHSGAGGRLHQMYSRLAAGNSDFSWSVLTKSRGAASAAVPGPRRIAAFSRGSSEFPSMLEAVGELAWAARQTRQGLLDGVDLVHIAGWTWAVLPLILSARRRRIPIVRELTTPGEAGSPSLGGRLIAWSNRQAVEVVAISPALEAGARVNLAGIPIWCRPNGVDIARFAPAGADERAKLRAEIAQRLPGLSSADLLVLHVGRVRPLKNQLMLADVVARLPRRYRLLLAGPVYGGDDRYASALRQRLAMPDLAGRAALIEGNVTNVERLMQAADIFAFPSTQEGLGTVAVEALCCGLPVVASRIPGVTDWLIKDGENGFLVSLDRDNLAAGLEAAQTLLPARPQIAEAAARLYHHARMDDGYRALFRRALGLEPAKAPELSGR